MGVLQETRQINLIQIRDTFLPVLFFVTVIAIWEFLTWYTNYPKSILPRPSAVMLAIYENWGLLTSNILPTASVALGGFLLAAITGLSLALLMT